MQKVYRVLVVPGGTEIGLEIFKALQPCKDIRLFSAGSDVSNHAPYVYANHFIMPSIHEAGWLVELNQIVADNSIDYLFPAHDDVIVALARNAEKLKARVVSSPLETCTLTRSKSATYRHLESFLPVPMMYSCIDEVSSYPVFVKPDRGQGGQDTHMVSGAEQLHRLMEEERGRIVLEYLPGEEYTVDCFSDRDAGLLFCSGRERMRIRSGISMSSKVSAQQDIFADYARIIGNRLAFHGAWFFQVKRNRQGDLALLEIAPRIAGTMALPRVQGINLPLLSIYEQERLPLTLLVNHDCVQIDRALVNRYSHRIRYSTVYVDLDDTLILHDRVNIQVISFLYQCVNEGRKIVLLTKHDKDLGATLAKFRLTGLFGDIVQIGKSDAKSEHIKERDAILIDDSFSERKAASDRLGINTYDCSMLEVLLDERR